jgi:hypothetical protein
MLEKYTWLFPGTIERPIHTNRKTEHFEREKGKENMQKV